MQLRVKSLGGLEVNSARCFCRGSEFSSQEAAHDHLYFLLQGTRHPVLAPMWFTCRQNTHIYQIFLKNLDSSSLNKLSVPCGVLQLLQ